MKTTVPASCRVEALLAAAALVLLAACGGQGPTPAKTPVAPGNVTATPGPGYITVAWTDNSDDETGFEVYRNATPGPTAMQTGTKVATVPANGTSYIDMDIELEREYRYTVVAVNGQGSSEEAAAPDGTAVPWHVDLMMGTSRRRSTDEWTASIAIVYLVFPPEVIGSQAVTAYITGPAGWHDDLPWEHVYECPPEQASCYDGSFMFRTSSSIAALTGDYEVSVTIDGTEYTATTHLDASARMDRPTGISVSSVSSSGLDVDWTNPADTQSAIVSIHRGTYGGRVTPYHLMNGDHFSFESLDLEDGAYGVDVIAVSTDLVNYPIKEAQFGMSYDYAPFYVGEVATACADQGEVVNVPDAALHQAIVDTLGLQSDTITCGDMARIVELRAPFSGVASMEGLQYAVNLYDLQLTDGEITDLSPLATLDSLTWVDLNINDISDIEPLRGRTNIRGLHVCCTEAKITDTSALATLTSMWTMNLGFHGLGDALIWPLLENYPDIHGLWLPGNDLTEFDHLLDYPQLDALDLGWHTIPNLSFLDVMDDLVFLDLRGAVIEDMSALTAKTALTTLTLSTTGISDIAFLEAFTELENLNLDGNDIADLAPLVANPGIGEGDVVDVRFNAFDPEDPAIAEQIQALLDRGVDLRY